VILLYFVYNIVAAILAGPFGKLSDRLGRKKLLVTGYLTFSLCYLGFAWANSQVMMVIVFILYGLYTALITGVERAFIAEVSPLALKGTMLGLHSTIVGIALLPASLIAGFLWDSLGASFPFIFGASLSLLAAVILVGYMKSSPVTK